MGKWPVTNCITVTSNLSPLRILCRKFRQHRHTHRPCRDVHCSKCESVGPLRSRPERDRNVRDKGNEQGPNCQESVGRDRIQRKEPPACHAHEHPGQVAARNDAVIDIHGERNKDGGINNCRHHSERHECWFRVQQSDGCKAHKENGRD